jgi:hypothetical protein
VSYFVGEFPTRDKAIEAKIKFERIFLIEQNAGRLIQMEKREVQDYIRYLIASPDLFTNAVNTVFTAKLYLSDDPDNLQLIHNVEQAELSLSQARMKLSMQFRTYKDTGGRGTESFKRKLEIRRAIQDRYQLKQMGASSEMIVEILGSDEDFKELGIDMPETTQKRHVLPQPGGLVPGQVEQGATYAEKWPAIADTRSYAEEAQVWMDKREYAEHLVSAEMFQKEMVGEFTLKGPIEMEPGAGKTGMPQVKARRAKLLEDIEALQARELVEEDIRPPVDGEHFGGGEPEEVEYNPPTPRTKGPSLIIDGVDVSDPSVWVRPELDIDKI